MNLHITKVGHGLAHGVSVGPLINEVAILRMEELVKDAKIKGENYESLGHGC